MRVRLLVIVLVLVGLLTVALGVPLGVSATRSTQQELFTDRLTDTVFFASVAERPIADAEPALLEAELARYDEVFDVAVTVVDRSGRRLATSRADPPELAAEDDRRLLLALAGRRSEPYPLLMPWDPRPLVIAEPVLVDGEVRGAVVTISPTGRARAADLRLWALLGVGALLALGVGVLVALPVVRWILRPVRRLDEGTGRVAAAVLAGADAEPVSDGTGPPELRRLSASFDRMADTVTMAQVAQRAFVADASHQLRNPLTALRLRLSSLHGHVDAAAADDHGAACEEAERLSTLLDGLLALARADRVARVETVDVDAAVADRLDAWRPLAEHTGLRLERDGPGGLAVAVPTGTIETVLDAVLDNAVKFTPSGGRIMVCTGAVDGRVEITVRDTGPGLAADELDRATDRFWRGPGQANVEGSGLGLAIAARTVERAGGGLRLANVEGGGLRVVALLPVPGDLRRGHLSG